MKECTLSEILEAREDRVRRREALFEKSRCPVLSMSMNIPGTVKDTPLVRRTFRAWLDKLRARFESTSAPGPEICYGKTGPELLWALPVSAHELKKYCIELEGSDPAGRLVDLDVYDENGRAVSRTDLGFPERTCIVCGAPGRACAAGQRHPVMEVRAEAERRMRSFFARRDPARFADLAVGSLIREVHVTPKPGLVDERNNGSHKDMDLLLMEKSARVLRPYFEACVRTGMEHASEPPEEVFSELRHLGLKAEKDMFRATGGVNTHKGAIYLFGILLGALGRLWQADRIPSAGKILTEGGRVAMRAAEEDFTAIRRKAASFSEEPGTPGLTGGERIYLRYGLKGARGEAAEGFPSVRETALPFLNANGMTEKTLPLLLLRFVALGKDTNLIARGGMETARKAVGEVRTMLLEGEPDVRDIEALDERYIQMHLSPGGSADLVAVSIFCYNLQWIEKLND